MHLTIESLIGFAEGRLSPESRLHVEQHIASCADCSAGISEWFLLFDLLNVTHYPSKSSFRSTMTLADISNSASNFQELFATGFFDDTASTRVSVPQISDCRHILFRAGDVDVDLRIGRSPRVIAGQMLRRKANYFLVAVPVGLSQNQREIQTTVTDMRGEFRFTTVPSGSFRLHADLPSYRLIGDFTIEEEEIH